MNLDNIRNEIDNIDNEIKRLFKQRMEIIKQVTEIKQRSGKSVLDRTREESIVSRLTENEDIETTNQLRELYTAIFNISRGYQIRNIDFEYGLIGHPLSHSYSGIIHDTIGKYRYDIIDISDNILDGFMTQKRFKGINVTIPYKKTVMKYCDELSEIAERIGSVNTIVKRGDGSLYGDNTDYKGFMYMCESAGISLTGKKIMILGSGGTSLTAQAVAKDCNADKIVVISRTGINNYNNLHLHKDIDVVINTTPVGMYPNTGVSAVDLRDFPDCIAVIDVIYNPFRTKLLLDAERYGIKYTNGLKMLTAQAVFAAELFTGKSVSDITDSIIHKFTNIILIGMPGCGKSTIGKLLAEKLGRKFIDTDELVEQQYRKSSAEIIKSQGEAKFREIEHETIKRVCNDTGNVIATGGGTVIREDNRDLLRQNGFIVWIQRPLDLLETNGRPLSDNIDEMYRLREPLYKKCCDIIAENYSDIDKTILDIIRQI